MATTALDGRARGGLFLLAFAVLLGIALEAAAAWPPPLGASSCGL